MGQASHTLLETVTLKYPGEHWAHEALAVQLGARAVVGHAVGAAGDAGGGGGGRQRRAVEVLRAERACLAAVGRLVGPRDAGQAAGAAGPVVARAAVAGGDSGLDHPEA
eukprot:1942-Hanusia_phi.AAC.6